MHGALTHYSAKILPVCLVSTCPCQFSLSCSPLESVASSKGRRIPAVNKLVLEPHLDLVPVRAELDVKFLRGRDGADCDMSLISPVLEEAGLTHAASGVVVLSVRGVAGSWLKSRTTSTLRKTLSPPRTTKALDLRCRLITLSVPCFGGSESLLVFMRMDLCWVSCDCCRYDCCRCDCCRYGCYRCGCYRPSCCCYRSLGLRQLLALSSFW